MKKRLALLFLSAVLVSATGGCGRNGQILENPGEDLADTQESALPNQKKEELVTSTEDTSHLQLGNAVEIPEGFKGELAEKEPLMELERVIEEYCSVAKEDYDDVRYYYNYVDLNGDSKDEILALVLGQKVPGIDGNVLLWLKEDGGNLTKESVRQSFAQVGVPVYISHHMTEGYRDLIITQNSDTAAVSAGAGGSTKEIALNEEAVPISLGQTYRILVWKGDRYQSLEEGTVLDDIRDKEGTAILTNNIESDFANDNYHYLGEAMK